MENHKHSIRECHCLNYEGKTVGKWKKGLCCLDFIHVFIHSTLTGLAESSANRLNRWRAKWSDSNLCHYVRYTVVVPACLELPYFFMTQTQQGTGPFLRDFSINTIAAILSAVHPNLFHHIPKVLFCDCHVSRNHLKPLN